MYSLRESNKYREREKNSATTETGINRSDNNIEQVTSKFNFNTFFGAIFSSYIIR